MSIPEEDRWRSVWGMGIKRMGDYRIDSEGKWKGQNGKLYYWVDTVIQK